MTFGNFFFGKIAFRQNDDSMKWRFGKMMWPQKNNRIWRKLILSKNFLWHKNCQHRLLSFRTAHTLIFKLLVLSSKNAHSQWHEVSFFVRIILFFFLCMDCAPCGGLGSEKTMVHERPRTGSSHLSITKTERESTSTITTTALFYMICMDAVVSFYISAILRLLVEFFVGWEPTRGNVVVVVLSRNRGYNASLVPIVIVTRQHPPREAPAVEKGIQHPPTGLSVVNYQWILFVSLKKNLYISLHPLHIYIFFIRYAIWILLFSSFLHLLWAFGRSR